MAQVPSIVWEHEAQRWKSFPVCGAQTSWWIRTSLHPRMHVLRSLHSTQSRA